MIEVHHLNNSRSHRILWLLEELELPYGIVPYQRDPVTRLAPPALKAIHPLGKSPVICDGGLIIAESGAIIEYLVGRYGNGRLAPARDFASPDYLAYQHWLPRRRVGHAAAAPEALCWTPERSGRAAQATH